MRLSVVPTRLLLRSFTAANKHHINMLNTALKAEVLLSEMNRKRCIEKFKSYRVSKVHGNVPEAAILIPLCKHNGQLGILYTLRSMKLTTNRGEVSFPGGKRDKSDADLIETALRETWEELKIPKEKVHVWTASSLIGKGNINVMPVLGYIGEVVLEELEINPDEVEEAFVVSLQKLCDPELCTYTRFHNSLTLPSYLGGKYRIWGFTGAITHLVLKSLIPDVYKNDIIHVKSLTSTEDKSGKILSSKNEMSKL